jgi:hypothetical protein
VFREVHGGPRHGRGYQPAFVPAREKSRGWQRVRRYAAVTTRVCLPGSRTRAEVCGRAHRGRGNGRKSTTIFSDFGAKSSVGRLTSSFVQFQVILPVATLFRIIKPPYPPPFDHPNTSGNST